MSNDSRVPSRALLAAAVGGLLCAGCDSSHDTDYDGGAAPRITAISVVADVTLESFTSDCDERGGAVELHSHCGGMNSCQGVSYDTGTHELMEHTCRALNTCSGFSCVVPEET